MTLHYPVDTVLINQNKCRTQALKQLLSTPPTAIRTNARTWRLAYEIARLFSHLQVKLSWERGPRSAGIFGKVARWWC